jgi:methyl-accepting chemotaxis protein
MPPRRSETAMSRKTRTPTAARKSPAKSSATKKTAKPRAVREDAGVRADLEGQIAAINRSLAVIEFRLDGTILRANDNFCRALGYGADEIVGQHHAMFVPPEQRDSAEYRAFWDRLGRGEYDAGQYCRVAKGGREIWIEASYNPIFDSHGKPMKVVKYATDITEARRRAADFQGQIAAISKAQAVIEFTLDGIILNANDNFCRALGYSLKEIQGQHHGMFVDPTYRASHEYRVFWDKLARGEYDSGQYKRFSKSGKEVWIQASYNPIYDINGKPFKVVKYATDVTEAKLKAADYEGQLAAIGKAQAVIEFDLKGNILNANDNFCRAMGYVIDEIRGQHHRLFVDAETSMSAEYRTFWDKLARGEYDSGQYKRIAKGGREIWIQASYNPIYDMNGKPFKVVKYATDITEAKLKAANYEGQFAAISKAQGIIEFKLDGTILDANENFLNTVGYRLDEIKGRHHSIFVDRSHRDSVEYRTFWEKLGRGEYEHGQYRRVGKDGGEIWIQASYNPILDLNGKPFKVVKYCTNVGDQVRAARQLEVAVNQTREVVTAASNGDLSARIPMDGKDGQLGELCSGVNAVIDSMAAVVGQIQEASASIRTSAGEIATGNTDLSARTEQQAASLEETAASMEELTSTVKQNAENARQANQLAVGASDVARKGGQVVSEVVTTMSAINDASKKIVDIIGVIDGIAFQTNILALNAAVEAARAGEQGRGFAVVASEVRSLAQRSAAAAKEIKSLIGDSVDKVGNGTRLVEQAGRTMEDIVASVKRVTDIMAEISAASQEQSQGIEQVNQAITQMDEVTQQNAALVEEASAAARALQEQANALAESVAEFTLEAEAEAPRGPRARRAAAPAPADSAPARSAARAVRPAGRPVATARTASRLAPARSPANGEATTDHWTEF